MKVIFIFGAGASFGAYRKHQSVQAPPLTASLFSDPRITQGATKGLALINLIEQARLNLGRNFDLESSLAKMAQSNSHERVKQLLDLKYAIHSVVRNSAASGFSRTPRPTSLYEDLWYRVKEHFSKLKHVYLINMNYDTLLDRAIELSEGQFTSFDSYILPEKWSLYHPHGNIGWGYKVTTKLVTRPTRSSIVEQAPQIVDSDLQLDLVGNAFPTEQQMLSRTGVFIPALALPVAGSNEKELFISPEEHILHMKKSCKNADVLIVIGWRALDKHLVEILSTTNFRIPEVHIVSGSTESAEQIKDTLESSGMNADRYFFIGGGFEEYLRHDAFSNLFPNPAL